MMMKLIIIYVILIGCNIGVFAQKNLIADGDFRTGTEKLNGSISNPGNLVWYGQTKDVGSRDGFQTEWIDLGYKQRVISASFANVSNRSTYLCQNVTGFEPNKRYQIGFWLKSNLPECALRVELRAHDWQNGKIIYNKKQLGSLEINSNKKNVFPEAWQYYSFTVNTQDIDPELLGSKYVRMLFFFNQSFASGNALYHNPESGQYKYWITDVAIKELPDLIPNSGFERWDVDNRPIELSGWQVENASVSLTKGWKSSDKAVQLTATNDENAMLLSSPLQLKIAGKYKVTYWARSDKKGTKLTGYINGNSKNKPGKLDTKWAIQSFVFDVSKQDTGQVARIVFEIHSKQQVEIDNITIE